MKDLLQSQYQLVKFSRNNLIDYIKIINESDFIEENSSFGRGSIRNLLVHICDTYAVWIGQRALKENVDLKPFEEYNSLYECLSYFSIIDGYVEEFINKFKDDFTTSIQILRDGEIMLINPLKLFTHVITHEFHHKGQIMSLSRHLNYIPVDTDIIP